MDSCCWQGDYLVELLREALRHDRTFMGAIMVYRRNRDRVITMSMELHVKAWALNQHRSEFSLTYPNLVPLGIQSQLSLKKSQVRHASFDTRCLKVLGQARY